MNTNNPLVGARHSLAPTGEAVYRVAPDDIVINNPSELLIVIPQLLADTYRLEITTQFIGNSTQYLKTPRTAVFDKILTVK
ncbi:MAG: DUF4469 domain-containing protein [Dysgonamonadaceae bacterium]|nr:DUF4469 domain-containing protein [Dysgonamonadaceae bacterium]